MRKSVIVLLVVFLVFTSCINVMADGIMLYLNGEEIAPLKEQHQEAIIKGGILYLPLRNIFEAIGAEVNYDDEEIAVVSGGMGVIFYSNEVGKNIIVTNDGEYELPYATIRVNDRVLIVKEALENIFGANVSVEDNKVYISYDEKKNSDEIDFSNIN